MIDGADDAGSDFSFLAATTGAEAAVAAAAAFVFLLFAEVFILGMDTMMYTCKLKRL